MLGKHGIWFSVAAILITIGVACARENAGETAVCDFTAQTAVTVIIHNESGEPQRLVNVRYRLDGSPWQSLPEVVNEQAVLRDGPGTYQIRLEKPGYKTGEITVVVGETEAESCQVAAETVTVPLALAVCPNVEPAQLEVEIVSESEAVVVTAVTPGIGNQQLTCARPEAANCSHYTLPLTNNGLYKISVTGLAGVGPMSVVGDVISYTLRTSQMTLRQESVNRTITHTGANSLEATFDVSPDEIGCPLVDFRSLTTQVEPDVTSGEPFPDLEVGLQSNLMITDLGGESCRAVPQPYPVHFEAILPIGTPLSEAGVFTLHNNEWLAASCEIQDGRFLCTASYPNPFVGQPFAYKVIAASEEYVGTSLPFDNLCLIFE